MVAMLKQDRNSPLTVEHQVIIIYAVVNNYLKDVPVKLISDYQTELFDHIDNSYLTSENEDALKQVLNDFTAKYIADKS